MSSVTADRSSTTTDAAGMVPEAHARAANVERARITLLSQEGKTIGVQGERYPIRVVRSSKPRKRAASPSKRDGM
jgi:hypothetical protein